MMVGLAALAPAWLPAPESQQKLAMSAVRFYRPDVKQTQVKAFIEIPYMMLEPSGEASDARVTYHVTVQVKDSTGLELVRNAWDSHAAAGVRQPGASALEILDFALAPGRYVVMVEVSDPVSGRKLDAELPIEGFRSEPEISDLLLAPKIRAAGAADTVPAPGEIRRDRLLITGSAGLILTPLRSKAFYLIETYNKKQDSIRIAMSVKDSTGKALISTPPTVTQLPVGGGGLTGALDLTGLPAGEYQLVAELTLEGRTVQRSGGFTMAPLSETLAKDVVRREANRVTDAGYFSEMSEREVDAAAAPLSLIASSQELSAYNKKLSLQAKRRFLSEFWSRRDPAPDTPRNEMREQFYAAIAYADEHFKEGGRATAPGWRTDRGRVYARHGLPDETLDRQQQGTAPPYQVWRYSKGKGQYYIFADRTGFGAYTLLSSNDLQEAGIPAWQRTLGLQAVQDIARFLNVDQIVLDPGTNF
jgi:GWxTD domain-containing protein